jgi:hypothetical protein
MSRVRVHNFGISIDGFGTGEGQSLETPFGHGFGVMKSRRRRRSWTSAIFAPTGAGTRSGASEGFGFRCPAAAIPKR